MENIITEAIQETLEFIIGPDRKLSYYLSVFFFSTLALGVSLYASSKKRDKFSPCTPEKFSTLFLIWDSTKRVLVTYVLIYLIARSFDLSSILAMIGVGGFLAAGLDQAIAWFMSKTNLLDSLKMNRENFPTIPNNEIPKSDNKDPE